MNEKLYLWISLFACLEHNEVTSYNSIWVVDQLSKLATFIPMNTTITTHELVYQLVDESFQFYGLSMDLANERDSSLLEIFGLKSLKH